MKNKLVSWIFGPLLMLAAVTSVHAQNRDPVPASIEFSGPMLTVPLKGGSVHPIAMVELGDEEGFKFVVDTGASVNVIDQAISEARGFEVVGRTAIGAPGGDKVPVDIVRVPIVNIGNGVMTDVEFVTLDIESMTGGLMQGVIGLPVFRDYLLTFDQAQDQIRVTRETLTTDESDVMAYKDSGGHIQIDVEVAGSVVETHVDTGSMASFTLPIELKTAMPLKKESFFQSGARLVGGNRKIERAQLDGDIVLAGHRYENPGIGFMDPSPGYGNVGSRVLGDYVLSIDQKNHLIRFQRNGSATDESSTPRQLGVELRGMPGGNSLTVGRVEAGSLGEQAGLLAGDELVSVNGKPTGDYEMTELGALIRGNEPLTLQVERGGIATVIEIQ